MAELDKCTHFLHFKGKDRLHCIDMIMNPLNILFNCNVVHFSRNTFATIFSALFILMIFTFTAHSRPPVGIYDLRYTLKIDTHNPKQVQMAWDHCHTVASLQGIVNRKEPQLYLIYVDSQEIKGKNIDQYWLDLYSQPGQWLSKRERVTYQDIEQLLTAYRSCIEGAVVYDPQVPATSNVASTVAGIKNLIAVRYDSSPDSLYHKLIVTGPEIPVLQWLVHPDGTSKFTGKGTILDTTLPSSGSAKCDAYLWMKHQLMDSGLCNLQYGAYYIDSYWQRKPTAAVLNHHTLTNHDFFVSQKAFFFDLSPWGDELPTDDPDQPRRCDLSTLKALLLSAYNHAGKDPIIHIGGFPPWAYKYTTFAGGKHGGVETEWEYAKIISAYNAFQDADAISYGAMANASFWAHFPLKKKYPQKWVSHQDLIERGYLTQDGKVNFEGKDFFVFYVGDYDAAPWIYQRTIDIWDHPDRGKVPLMWCISPVLERRAPMVMHYMRTTATSNDYFAAADNGAGYLNPGMLQEPRPISSLPSGLKAWEKHCSRYYQRWDLTITGFIIDGYAPGLNQAGLDCYEQFSPNGIVPQIIPLTLLHNNMPVMRAVWDVNQDNPTEAAACIVDQVNRRSIPFHWFRNVLKSPSWYVQVLDRLKETNPEIELLDAPTFFELYRIYLKNHPEAAEGRLRK